MDELLKDVGGIEKITEAINKVEDKRLMVSVISIRNGTIIALPRNKEQFGVPWEVVKDLLDRESGSKTQS